MENPCVWIDIISDKYEINLESYARYLLEVTSTDEKFVKQINHMIDYLLPYGDVLLLHFSNCETSVVSIHQVSDNPQLLKAFKEAMKNIIKMQQEAATPEISEGLCEHMSRMSTTIIKNC